MWTGWIAPAVSGIIAETPVLIALPPAVAAAIAAFALARRSWHERALVFSLAFSGQVIALAYLLSVLDQLASLTAWFVAGMGVLVACAAVLVVGSWARRHCSRALAQGEENLRPTARVAQGEGNLRPTAPVARVERLVVGLCVGTVVLTGLLQLVVVCRTAPGNWDSMTYHLARVAYYLQQGNFDYYDANYWAQVTHAKNATALLLFTYLASGRNENLMQLVQYASYWVCLIAAFGLARTLGATRRAALFAAAVCGLLTIVLMQATTTQNDLVVAAYVGCTAYFLARFRSSGSLVDICFAAAALALALGVKASAAGFVPGLAMLAAYAFWPHMRRSGLRNAVVALSALAISGVIFTLPAGYLDNLRRVGHAVSTSDVQQHHSFAGMPTGERAVQSMRNLGRFAADFVTLDGFAPTGDTVRTQLALQSPLRLLNRALDLRLEDTAGRGPGFEWHDSPRAHEDVSSFGVLGFALLWPTVLFLLVAPQVPRQARLLCAVALVVLITQAAIGPYDPWRGRYFAALAVLACPVLALWVQRRQAWPLRAYLLVIVMLGCFSGLSAVVFHCNSPLMTLPPHWSGPRWGQNRVSIFALDRCGQLTRNRPVEALFRQIDAKIPPDATVAVLWGPNQYEYPLFGPRLERRIIPVASFYRDFRPLPAAADYYLFERDDPAYFRRHGHVVPAELFPKATDRRLIGGVYVRRLGAPGEEAAWARGAPQTR